MRLREQVGPGLEVKTWWEQTGKQRMRNPRQYSAEPRTWTSPVLNRVGLGSETWTMIELKR